MNDRQGIFLNSFDSSFRTAIIEFGKRLTELSKQYDVMIFMARKAICLADSLISVKLMQIHCQITSSRVLDMRLDWLVGKRIAIVDDALICGSTLRKTLDHLKNSGIPNVDVHVLCVDNKYWVEKIVTPIPPYVRLESAQVSLICAQMVEAIAVSPRPYNIDFPIYSGIRIPESSIQELSWAAGWLMYETTTERQRSFGITNMTLLPSQEVTTQFLTHQLGLDCASSSIFKIRFYGMRLNDIHWFKALPVVVLPSIAEDDLDALFDAIIGDSKTMLSDWFNSGDRESSAKAKLRLVQYYLGCRLFWRWRQDLNSDFETKTIFSQDLNNLNFLFPAPLTNELLEVFSQTDLSFRDIKITFYDQGPSVVDQRNDGFGAAEGMSLLTQLFVKDYRELELPARLLVREIAEEEGPLDSSRLPDRLDRGRPFSELVAALEGLMSCANPERIVSAFLDTFIDEGAIVPVIVFEDGVVYRAYRHGEDVEFAEKERRLCGLTLNSFCENYGKREIPHTILEKLLVLFVRIGIEKKFLHYAKDYTPQYEKIGIRFYLHGAIAGSFGKKMYDYARENSLADQLVRLDYLDYANPGDQQSNYVVKDMPVTGIAVDGEGYAKMVGLVLGAAMKLPNPAMPISDMILIATCPYPFDTLAALAAELKIHNQNYKRLCISSKQFTNISQNWLIKLRSKPLLVSLNSGTWKYLSYKKGRPWRAINDVESALNDSLQKSVWRDFWPNTGAQTNSEDAEPIINERIAEIASIEALLRFYYNVATMSLCNTYQDVLSSTFYKENLKLANDISPYLPSVYKEMRVVNQDIAQRCNAGSLLYDKLYEFAISKIQRNVAFGDDVLIRADLEMEQYGTINKVDDYDHVLSVIVDDASITRGEINRIIGKVIESVHIRAKKPNNGGGRAFVQQVPQEMVPGSVGIWIALSGANSRRWLSTLCIEIFEQLKGRAAIRFKAFLFMRSINMGLFKRRTTNEFYGERFWHASSVLSKEGRVTFPEADILYFVARQDASKTITAMRDELSKIYDETGSSRITINEPDYSTFEVVAMGLRSANEIEYSNSKRVDIGIITVLVEELQAVKDAFKARGTCERYDSAICNRRYFRGSLRGDNGETFTAIATQTISQGQVSASIAYSYMMEEFNPSVVVLLGIAGAANAKIKIGDVVVAKGVIGYDRRAETEKGIQHRIDAFTIGADVKAIYQRFQQEYESTEVKLPAAAGSLNSLYTTYLGEIGSGSAVIKTVTSETRDWLAGISDQIYAVETESAGVCQQFDESALDSDRSAKMLLLIRGISDGADIDKKDDWHKTASANAMNTLIEIIRQMRRSDIE